MRSKILGALLLFPVLVLAQINTERVMNIARNALYFEDYVLSIQYFNQVINAKPYLFEPYLYRGLAKLNLDDYQGAEVDCDSAIHRNPFMVGAYQLRGLARIKQNNYEGAISDYKTALNYDPENVVLWHNLSLCHIQREDYDSAKKDLGRMMEVSPRYMRAYLMRGDVYLREQDTLRALADFEKVISHDQYDPDGWSARAIVRLQQGKYKEAEDDLNHAIHLGIQNASNYINRALARFYQNNLRGAMSDYDLAINVDPNNFLGHYNRGLLRAQVGDDNRAIEDFDFVLNVEPNNMMALFNRGLLKAQVGDLKGAVSDYSRVLDEYPNFITGYYHRAEARRKMGDRRGAEQDEYKIVKIQVDRRNKTLTASNHSNTIDSDSLIVDETADKTRKKSDKNVENYRKIVIADDEGSEPKYKSDYRGKIQDRNVAIKLEPMFALTYYERQVDVKNNIHYHKSIDELNHLKLLPKSLRITNMEAPLSQEQALAHFALLDTHSSDVIKDEKNAVKWFMRGLDFYLVQDFMSSVEDLTKSILLDENFFPAYFMRALVRYKHLEYKKAEAALVDDVVVMGSDFKRNEIKTVDYDVVKEDLNRVIQLSPDFVYAYFNRGNMLSMLKDYRNALSDYDKAIELNPHFAEAYYNRGLTHIYLGNNKQGISDLSKAGELGVVASYNVIKRFSLVEK